MNMRHHLQNEKEIEGFHFFFCVFKFKTKARNSDFLVIGPNFKCSLQVFQKFMLYHFS